MSGNEIDTRPRVCLTKPNRSVTANAERELPSIMPEHIAEEVIPCVQELPSFTPEHIYDEVIPSTQHQREFTPVHLCAEYSPEPQTSVFANVLSEMIENNYLQYFFSSPKPRYYEVELRHNRVVLSHRLNPLTDKQYIESPLLNALQDLGEYMASTGATVNGIISLLISREDDFGEMPLYSEWCKLLRDIRDNDVSKIEAVLSGEREDCYSSLGTIRFSTVLPKQVHCYLFTALQDVLERETEVMVNPLFLFLCENLRCYPTITYEQPVVMRQDVIGVPQKKLDTDYFTPQIMDGTARLYAMYQLTAYGTLNATSLTLPSPPSRLLRGYVEYFVSDPFLFFSCCSIMVFPPYLFKIFENGLLASESAISLMLAFGCIGLLMIAHIAIGELCKNKLCNKDFEHLQRLRQLGYMHWKSNFIPITAAQSAVLQIESLKMLADEITGERNDK